MQSAFLFWSGRAVALNTLAAISAMLSALQRLVTLRPGIIPGRLQGMNISQCIAPDRGMDALPFQIMPVQHSWLPLVHSHAGTLSDWQACETDA